MVLLTSCRTVQHLQFKTQISMPRVGGSATPRLVRTYTSCSLSISKSLYKELCLKHESRTQLPSPLVNDQRLQLPPLLMLPDTGDMVHLLFNPIDKEIIRINKSKSTNQLPNNAWCFWSSHGCLAFVDPCDCGLYLWDFKHVVKLPSIETLSFVPRVIRNDDGSIKNFIYKKVYFMDRSTPKKLSDLFEWGLTLSSAPSLSWGNSNNDNMLVMIINGCGSWCNLVSCKPGGAEWTQLDGPLLPYQNVIASTEVDKLFYAIGHKGKTEAWDLNDLSSIKRTLITDDTRLFYCKFDVYDEDACYMYSNKPYLVESSEDLLLIRPYANRLPKGFRFLVYKLDFSRVS